MPRNQTKVEEGENLVNYEDSELQCEGFGGRAKRRAVKSLVTFEDVDMLPVQETNSNWINNSFCMLIWGDDGME